MDKSHGWEGQGACPSVAPYVHKVMYFTVNANLQTEALEMPTHKKAHVTV